MSLMLKALKQIEAHHPETQQAVEPVSAEELVSFGLARQATPWTAAEVTAAAETMEVTAQCPEPCQAPPPEEPKAHQAIPLAPLEAPESPRLKIVARPPESDVSADPYVELADKILARCRADRSTAFLFTSPGDREGKTSTLVPLAMVLAERLGDEVVLVDANFVRPEVAHCFELSVPGGLADVLQGTRRWQEMICPTPSRFLSVLPGGRFPTSPELPPDLLEFGPLLEDLRRHYRLILFDSPSLAHRLVTPLVAHCDGVYLLVQLGRTSRSAVRQALAVLKGCGAHLVGGIVTQGAR